MVTQNAQLNKSNTQSSLLSVQFGLWINAEINDDMHANVHIIFAQPLSERGANHTQTLGLFKPSRFVSLI